MRKRCPPHQPSRDGAAGARMAHKVASVERRLKDE